VADHITGNTAISNAQNAGSSRIFRGVQRAITIFDMFLSLAKNSTQKKCSDKKRGLSPFDVSYILVDLPAWFAP
jgi:hypothetical protein